MSTTVIDLANCGITGNVGKFFCHFNPTIYKYFLLVPKGTVIPTAELDSNTEVADYIYAGLINDTPAQRWLLSGVLSQFNDRTEDVKTENKDGYMAPTQFPPYNWTYDMTLQFAQFVKWKSKGLSVADYYDVFFIDDAGNLIGRNASTGLGAISLYTFYFNDQKQATVDTLVKFLVNMTILNNDDLNENARLVQAGLTPQDWATVLYDCVVVQGTANTSTAIKVQCYTDGVGAKTSLLAKYHNELDVAAAWVLTKNGASLTPSGVAYDSANDQMVFTILALSSLDVVTVDLAAPSVLTATPYFINAVTEGTQYTYTHP